MFEIIVYEDIETFDQDENQSLVMARRRERDRGCLSGVAWAEAPVRCGASLLLMSLLSAVYWR